MRKFLNRSLSCILAAVLVFGTVGSDVYAAGTDGGDIQAASVTDEELIDDEYVVDEALTVAADDGEDIEAAGQDDAGAAADCLSLGVGIDLHDARHHGFCDAFNRIDAVCIG